MQLNFNAANVPQSKPFEPIPTGWYNVKIVEITPTPTKDNATSGSWYLKLQLEVIDGEFKGRKLFHNLNMKNTNPEAVRISTEQLSTICHSVGRIQIGHTNELLGLPFMAKTSVKIDPTGTYEPSNDVKGFKPLEQGGPGSMGAMGGGGPAAAAGFSGQPDFGNAGGGSAPSPSFTADPPGNPAPAAGGFQPDFGGGQAAAAAPAPAPAAAAGEMKAPWEQ